MSKKIAFLLWLDTANRALLTDEFVEDALRDAKGKLRRTYVKQFLSAGDKPPLRFEALTAHDMEVFITSLKKRDGSKVSSATHNTARSALRDLYRSYNVSVPQEVDDALEKFFKGLKRQTAKKSLKVRAGFKLESRLWISLSMFSLQQD